jgi:hypothetical protein
MQLAELRKFGAPRGLMGSVEIGFLPADKVNSLWPNPQLLIALHSSNALLETGLRMSLPEKSQDTDRWFAHHSGGISATVKRLTS